MSMRPVTIKIKADNGEAIRGLNETGAAVGGLSRSFLAAAGAVGVAAALGQALRFAADEATKVQESTGKVTSALKSAGFGENKVSVNAWANALQNAKGQTANLSRELFAQSVTLGANVAQGKAIVTMAADMAAKQGTAAQHVELLTGAVAGDERAWKALAKQWNVAYEDGDTLDELLGRIHAKVDGAAAEQVHNLAGEWKLLFDNIRTGVGEAAKPLADFLADVMKATNQQFFARPAWLASIAEAAKTGDLSGVSTHDVQVVATQAEAELQKAAQGLRDAEDSFQGSADKSLKQRTEELNAATAAYQAALEKYLLFSGEVSARAPGKTTSPFAGIVADKPDKPAKTESDAEYARRMREAAGKLGIYEVPAEALRAERDAGKLLADEKKKQIEELKAKANASSDDRAAHELANETKLAEYRAQLQEAARAAEDAGAVDAGEAEVREQEAANAKMLRDNDERLARETAASKRAGEERARAEEAQIRRKYAMETALALQAYSTVAAFASGNFGGGIAGLGGLAALKTGDPRYAAAGQILGASVNSGGGAMLGAGAGALIGTAIPGVGTLVGAGVGSVLGSQLDQGPRTEGGKARDELRDLLDELGIGGRARMDRADFEATNQGDIWQSWAEAIAGTDKIGQGGEILAGAFDGLGLSMAETADIVGDLIAKSQGLSVAEGDMLAAREALLSNAMLSDEELASLAQMFGDAADYIGEEARLKEEVLQKAREYAEATGADKDVKFGELKGSRDQLLGLMVQREQQQQQNQEELKKGLEAQGMSAEEAQALLDKNAGIETNTATMVGLLRSIDGKLGGTPPPPPMHDGALPMYHHGKMVAGYPSHLAWIRDDEAVVPPEKRLAYAHNIVADHYRGGGGGGGRSVTYNFPNYLGSRRELVREIDSLTRRARDRGEIPA